MFMVRLAESSIMLNGTMSNLKLNMSTDTSLAQGTKAAVLNTPGPEPNSITKAHPFQ